MRLPSEPGGHAPAQRFSNRRVTTIHARRVHRFDIGAQVLRAQEGTPMACPRERPYTLDMCRPPTRHPLCRPDDRIRVHPLSSSATTDFAGRLTAAPMAAIF